MKIAKGKRIEEVQADFNLAFPGLKLNFFKTKHDVHEGSLEESLYSQNSILGDIQPILMDGYVVLDSKKTVQDLETELENRFGLHVQVYRRSNMNWLQTTATDDWTLDYQNKRALESIKY